jgi:hypothetical protein
MNSTPGDYSDQLEGNNLACAPGNEADGLEFLCTVLFPTMGLGTIANGLAFGFQAFVRWRSIQLKVAASTTAANTAGKSPPQRTNSNNSKYTQLARNYLAVKVLCAVGATSIFTGLSFLLHGFCTMFPTTHIRSQFGDFAGKSIEADIDE